MSLVQKREVVCVSPREPLWHAMADTRRFNKQLGNSTVEFEPLFDAGAARYLAHQKLAGLSLEYEERPFEWNVPDYLAVTRLFRNGPARRYRYELRLEELEEGGTRVALTLELEARSALVWPFVRVNAARYAGKIARLIEGVDRNLAAGRVAYPDLARTAANADPLDRALAVMTGGLEGELAELAGRLAAYVRDAEDIDLERIRPYELALSWGVDRRALLAVCLHAVTAGLLELSWDIVCPSCRTAAENVPDLDALGDDGHCQMCDIDISVDLDQAVEATFRPAEAVRRIHAAPYCIGGPFATPHVKAQAILPAGGEHVVRAPRTSGVYRLFVRGGAAAEVQVTRTGDAAAEVAAGEAAATPSQLVVAPGASIQVNDRAAHERHVKLEDARWDSRAATAHEVSTIPTFRRLFSAQVLRPGLMLKVQRVAFLFTDLCGSTALYERVGDAEAYRLVQDHFDLLIPLLERHRGALVKTIGDAVMGAFPDEADAARCAVAMQRDFARFLAARTDTRELALRVGVNAGPCFAANANGLLDYFGRAVNTAVRLEAAARPGEIVVPAAMHERGVDAGWFAGAELVELFDAELRGIDAPVPAARLAVV